MSDPLKEATEAASKRIAEWLVDEANKDKELTQELVETVLKEEMWNAKVCPLCEGNKYRLDDTFKLINCPACYGTGRRQIGFGEGQEHPNLGVNLPAGAAVAVSACAQRPQGILEAK